MIPASSGPPSALLVAILALIAVSIGAAVAVSVVAWRRPTEEGRALVALMTGVALWSVTYFFELLTTDPAVAVWLIAIRYLGIAVLPVAWLVFCLQFTGRSEWVTDRTVVGLAVVPLVTVVLVWTNQWHGLVWTVVVEPAGAPVVSRDFEPWYWINVGYTYLAILVGIGLLVELFVNSPVYRRQAGAMLVAAAVPLTWNALYQAEVTPTTIDLTSVSFSVTGVLIGLALFRFDLLDLHPVAQRTVIGGMDSGVIVVDARHVVVEGNPAGRQILDVAAGDDAREHLDRVGIDPFDPTSLDGRTTLATGVQVDGSGLENRYFDVSTHQLTERSEVIGYILVFQDVTEREHREQRLEVLNRVLRHNLRNDMTLILGLTTELERTTGGDDDVRLIRERSERLVSLAEKARAADRSFADGEVRTIDVADVVRHEVEDIERRFPDVTVTVDIPDECRAVAHDSIDLAIANLLENAIEHTRLDEPHVSITVTSGRDGVVELSVADDGPGIPTHERRVVSVGRETTMEHGSGLGLWIVRWAVFRSGGELAFDESEGGGSVVTISLDSPSDS